VSVESIEEQGRGGAQLWLIKIEVNTVFRGTLLPVREDCRVSSAVIRRLGIDVKAPTLDPTELCENEGLSQGLLDCLVVYLAGLNRPTHEVLGGKDKILDQIYEEQFLDMTEIEPPSPPLDLIAGLSRYKLLPRPAQLVAPLYRLTYAVTRFSFGG